MDSKEQICTYCKKTCYYSYNLKKPDNTYQTLCSYNCVVGYQKLEVIFSQCHVLRKVSTGVYETLPGFSDSGNFSMQDMPSTSGMGQSTSDKPDVEFFFVPKKDDLKVDDIITMNWSFPPENEKKEKKKK